MIGLQNGFWNKSVDLIGHSSHINFTSLFDIESEVDTLNV